ncbi:MAG: hypothetical protein AAF502_16600 [Bacteroidota bacterium]
MKNSILLSSLLLLALGFFAFNYSPDPEVSPDKEVKVIQGFKLKAKANKVIKKHKIITTVAGQETKLVQISKAGVVRPTEGYKMILDQENERIAVVASGAEYRPDIVGLDGHEVPWGLYLCWCPDWPDDCKFETYNTNDPNSISLDCEGYCGCGISFIPKNASVDWEGSRDQGLF